LSFLNSTLFVPIAREELLSSARAAQLPFFRHRLITIAGVLLAALVISPATASATALPTTISENTTLTAAGSPYTGSSTTISEGVTVTAEPGALVKLTGTLTAKGTLDVNGTAEKPVVFTSSTNSAPGQWTGIVLQAGAGASSLSHAEVRYAKTGIAISGGISPEIVDSFIHHGSSVGVSVTAGGAPEIARNIVADNSSTGISYAYTGTSNQLKIHDNLVERNNSGGIRVSPSGTVALTHVHFGDNEVNDNGGQAIYFQGPTIPADIDENFLSGNAKNGIWVSGTVAESTTWQDRGYPFVSSGSHITVAEGATLTLEPGSTIKGDLRGVIVNGTLVADGTEEEPITFTSIKDDSVDGDTNGDGSATVPAPGNWTEIKFIAKGTGLVDHARIRYGGFFGPMVSVSCPCSAPPSITNSTLMHSQGGGISTGASSAKVTGNTIANNVGTGIYAGGGAPEIAFNEISSNARGIEYAASVSTTSGQINIHDNAVEENTSAGIRVNLNSSAPIQPVTLGGNTVVDTGAGNPGDAVFYSGATIPADIDENFLSGNAKNGIWVSGTVAESTTWQDRGYPFVSSGSHITVAEGATLTLEPGSTIKGDLRGVIVNGTLVADGTEEEPITFTSIKDDSVDGDTNGDGSATVPAPGNWTGIFYPSVASASLSHIAFHFAKSAIDIEYLDSMTISNSDFIHNEAAIEVAQTAENDPGLAALPCVPPWLSFILSSNNWFGEVEEAGYPTPSMDISSAVGAPLPEEYAPLFEAAASLGSISAPLYPGGDTVPFAIYSCPEIGIPPTVVTPVIVTSVPLGPWFPVP
jgi:hypothetical protein